MNPPSSYSTAVPEIALRMQVRNLMAMKKAWVRGKSFDNPQPLSSFYLVRAVNFTGRGFLGMTIWPTLYV
jgi:hypothetical protein